MASLSAHADKPKTLILQRSSRIDAVYGVYLPRGLGGFVPQSWENQDFPFLWLAWRASDIALEI